MVGTTLAHDLTTRGVRAELLAAATRRFAAQGFEATSLQEIADDVGVAKPSLLHHFPSKDALRQSVLEQILAHWTETLPRILLAASASESRFDAVTEELVGFFVADPDRARLILREALDRPAAIRGLLGERVRPWVAAVASYVRKGQEHQEHYADIDAEAYVLAVAELVIITVASSAITSTLLAPTKGREHGGSLERLLRETLRIAKASLFTPTTKSGPASTRNKTVRRKGPR